MHSARSVSTTGFLEEAKELPAFSGAVPSIAVPPNSPREAVAKSSPRRSRTMSLVRAISTRFLSTESGSGRAGGSQIVAPVSARLSLHARSSSAPDSTLNTPSNKLIELMSDNFAALTEEGIMELTAQERTIVKTALEKTILACRTPQEEESFAPRHSSPLRDTLDADDRVKNEALCRTLSHWIDVIAVVQKEEKLPEETSQKSP